MPPATSSLLGLRLKFCPTRPLPTDNTNKISERFNKDVRISAFFKDKQPNARAGIHYIPTLNIKNDSQKPLKTGKVIEGALGDVKKEFRSRQRNYQKELSTLDVTIRQWKTMDFLNDNDEYIVVEADKNLVGGALDRAVYNIKG